MAHLCKRHFALGFTIQWCVFLWLFYSDTFIFYKLDRDYAHFSNLVSGDQFFLPEMVEYASILIPGGLQIKTSSCSLKKKQFHQYNVNRRSRSGGSNNQEAQRLIHTCVEVEALCRWCATLCTPAMKSPPTPPLTFTRKVSCA